MDRESVYQNKLIAKIHEMFPDCFIIKNDPAETQGLPDLLILFGDNWAALEVKPSAGARKQPNQQHYIEKFDEMAFGSFIYPECEQDVLDDLSTYFYGRVR